MTAQTGELDAAKSKVQADIAAINSVMSGANAKGIKIPAPDLSAMDSAKAKLATDLAGIKSELAAAEGKPAAPAGPAAPASATLADNVRGEAVKAVR